MGVARGAIGVRRPLLPCRATLGLAALNRGDLLILACAFMFALHVISIGHYGSLFSWRADADPGHDDGTVYDSLRSVFASIRAEQPRVAWTPGLILAVIGTGLFATALAFSVQVWAQQYAARTMRRSSSHWNQCLPA